MARKTLIVLFNLKDNSSVDAYERWAKETDIPVAGHLRSVDDFKVYRCEGIFGSDAEPPYQYVEVLHINNFESLPSDIQSEPRMSEISKQFQTFADNPIFMVTEEFGS